MMRFMVPEWDVPTNMFTPKDHHVQLLEAAIKENIIACIGASDSNSFIALLLAKEKVYELYYDSKFALFVLASGEAIEHQIENFRYHSNLPAIRLSEECDYQGSQVVLTTAEDLVNLGSKLDLTKICLVVFEEVHKTLSNATFRQALSMVNKPGSHLVAFASSIVRTACKPTKLAEKICALEQAVSVRCETASDIVSTLKYASQPVELIIEYETKQSETDLEFELRELINPFNKFLQDHRFDMTEYLGDDEEVIEMMNSLPNPTEIPLNMINELLGVLDTFGPWGADRAALNYLIQLEKLKDRSCYDRHFLIFCALFSLMLQIRAKCEEVFFRHTERERLQHFTKPKVLRLIEILKQFKKDGMVVKKKREEPDPSRFQPVGSAYTNLTGQVLAGRRRRDLGPRPQYHVDYNAFLGIIFVEQKASAKILYHILKDASRCEPGMDFIQPLYICGAEESGDGSKEAEVEAKKQEDVLRKFRNRDCNLLASTSVLEEGIDVPPCHLVLRFDVPKTYRTYVGSKSRAKATDAHFLIMCQSKETQAFMTQMAQYHSIERILIRRCLQDSFSPEDELISKLVEETIPSYAPFGPEGTKVEAGGAIHLVNRYCAKLPSDSFTRLTPLWSIEERLGNNTPLDYVLLQNAPFSLSATACSKVEARYEAIRAKEYRCLLRLPINSPLRCTIVGPWMKTQQSARRSAALEVCKRLHSMHEIDDDFNPVSKEGVHIDPIDEMEVLEEELTVSENPNVPRPGTTKRRQYYYKETASCLKDCLPAANTRCYLYWMKMTMVEALTAAQNTRGRKIHRPENAAQGFGILTAKRMPKTCTFPVFTRSGEVSLEIVEVGSDIFLTEAQLEDLKVFQRYTFRNVLKLDKYPMVYDPDCASSDVLIVPLLGVASGQPKLDLNFAAKISRESETKPKFLSDADRKSYRFSVSDFSDAVVLRWYRDQDYPQCFYVAEICTDLNPLSGFPDDKYKSFREYYFHKYGIRIQNSRQPLLDVDHTSSRLNFLTPRYLNRKGMLLPTSSDETKRLKREGLQQKQILVPELCVIHPFPASLWRQAVSLPSIMYRLNGLLVAEDFCRLVAESAHIGHREFCSDWSELQFMWKRKEKPDSQSSPPSSEAEEIPETKPKPETSSENDDSENGIGIWNPEMADSIPAMSEADRLLLEEGYSLEDLNFANLTMIEGLNGNGLETIDTRGWDAPIGRDGTDNFGNTNGDVTGWGPNEEIDKEGSDVYAGSDLEDNFSEEEEPDFRYANDDDKDFGPKMVTRGDTAEAIEDANSLLKRKTTCLLEQVVEEDGEEWDVDAASITDQQLRTFADLLHTHKTQLFRDNLVTANQSFILESGKGGSSDKTVVEEIANVLVGEQESRSIEGPEIDVRPYLSSFDPEEFDFGFRFDAQPDLANHPGPNPGVVLQTLTMSNANDGINLERLETVGDSFLKFAITVYLFCKYRRIHEGKLSHLRSKRVSNLNLYRLGRKKNLGAIMIATKFNPHDNWLPPGYHVPSCLEQALIDSGIPHTYWNLADLRGLEKLSSDEVKTVVMQKMEALRIKLGSEIETEFEEIRQVDDDDELPSTTGNPEDMPQFVPYNLLTQHSIPDKSVADCVEALIGAYLIECGLKGALLLMTWFGLRVMPLNEKGEGQFWRQPESPIVVDIPRPVTDKILNRMLVGYEQFENEVQYRFRDRAYLLQAFTHASYYPNTITDCYQRLEFLGDAVLDYIITRFLYEDPRQHSPGALTDLRSALVNNTTFAVLAVRHGFHHYFKHYSYPLSAVLDRFIRMQEENGHKVSEEFYYIEEDESEGAEDIEVPKALGDVFESIAGAIYVDSGMSLDEVWRVYYRIMRPEIEAFAVNVPKSPIRELLELETDRVKFGKAERTPDGRVRVTVDIIGKKSFKGVGRNYRIAKCTAAKFALRTLERLGMLNKRKE